MCQIRPVFARSIALSASQSTRPSIAGTGKNRIEFTSGTMWQVRQRACPASGHAGQPTARWPGFGSSAQRHRSGSPFGVGQGRVGLSHSLKQMS